MDSEKKNQVPNVIRNFLSSTIVLAILNCVVLLVGFFFIRFVGTNIFVAIGTSLVASAIVTFATLWINFIKTQEENLLKKIKKKGILDIHEGRSLTNLYQPLLQKVENIDVTGYSLTGFLNQSLQIISLRANQTSPIKVRILLVDPESEASKKQESIENQSPNSYKTACENVIRNLGNVPGVEIKYIDHALPIMIYRLGNRLFTGHYSANPQSRSSSTATIEIDQSGELFDYYMSEFNSLWSKGKKVC